ncbi:MAG: hypothetical protein HDR43_01820 [Mycoplasma sp.]|nr:hypothetical protein [Mycoplasma sp.]
MIDKKNDNEKKNNQDKKKKPASSFFSNLNTDSSIEYGFAEKNPKSKWAKWVIGGLISVATIVGVSVPWAMSSCSVALSRPYSNNEVMYEYKDPITGIMVPVTYDEFANRVQQNQTNVSIFDKWDDVFYESVLETLYNEEREAFLKFKAIYYKVHDNKNPEISNFGADLNVSFSDIKSEQRKTLEENKKTFQKAVGNNWLNNWLKELQTNSIYGPQQTDSNETVSSISFLEDKAVAYMVTQQIKSSALARYSGASISTSSWNYVDFTFANTLNPSDTEEYTTYKDNSGVTQKITKKQAVDIWKSYLTKDVNVVQPKNITSSNNTKIAVFETKSYSTNYRNPIQNQNTSGSTRATNNDLITLLNNNFNLGLLSSFTISGITPGESNSSAFGITSDALKSLFTIQNTNSQSSVYNFAPISRITNFKGANLVNTSTDVNSANAIENEKDQLLVKTFESDNSVIGSSKIVETSSLIYADSSLNMFSLTAFSSSDSGITSIDTSSSDNSLFSIYKESNNSSQPSTKDTTTSTNSNNPLSNFIKLLLTISTNTANSNSIDFTSYNKVKTNWDNLNYGSTVASSNLSTFVKLINDNFDSSTLEFSNKINPQDFNVQLENALSGLAESDFTFIGKLLNCVLIGDANTIKTNYKSNQLFQNQVGYWSLYELSAPDTTTNSVGTYLYVASDGIKIFSKKFNNFTLDDYKNMILSDLNQTINVSESETANLYYDVSSLFSKLNNDNLIAITLLEDANNVNTFKTAINKYLNSSETKRENSFSQNVESVYSEFYKYVQSQWNLSFVENISNIRSQIPTSLEELINSGRNYDFATLTNNNGEDIVVFQTQTKYNGSSVLKTNDQINEVFIQKITSLLTPTKKTTTTNPITKGGK